MHICHSSYAMTNTFSLKRWFTGRLPLYAIYLRCNGDLSVSGTNP
jgi:hypothetical protein